jgi:DNA-binding NarL/FixJ family response regulator
MRLSTNKTVLFYGILLAALVVVIKTIEYKWLLKDISWQLYVLLIAVIFTLLGMWLSHHLVAKKNSVFKQNTTAIKEFGLSKREVEVLQKINEGLSNQAIADQLFVSVNTIKTHLKSSFSKLSVSNRIEAINKLKQFNIIA